MDGFELSMRRLQAGHKMRFFQDFYGRQWVKISGGWMFWRTGKIYLKNEEIVELKRALARRQKSRANVGERVPSTGSV